MNYNSVKTCTLSCYAVLIALPLLAAVLFSQPFLTSAKEVMFSSLFVCLSGCFCLFVCLPATLHKNFQTDLHEIFREG